MENDETISRPLRCEHLLFRTIFSNILANIFLINFSFTIGWAFGTLKSSQFVSDIFGGADPTSGHSHMTSSSQWESGSDTVRMRNGFPINTFQNFNISLFENDPEFYDFVRSVIPRPQERLKIHTQFWLADQWALFLNLIKLKSFNSNFPGSDSKSKPAIRKYMTLKQMIMFFQKTPVFGKFSFYGCWCFPDGASDILSGYGEPVDNIDKEWIQKLDLFSSKMVHFSQNFVKTAFKIIDINPNFDQKRW